MVPTYSMEAVELKRKKKKMKREAVIGQQEQPMAVAHQISGEEGIA